MLGDILLYGSAAFGCAVAVRRIQWKSLRNYLPSKTLKGSPEDLDPTFLAISLVLPKIIQDFNRVEVLRNELRYTKTGDDGFSFKIDSLYDFDGDRPCRWRVTLRKDALEVDEAYLPSDKKRAELHEFVNTVSSLKAKKKAQDARQKKDEVALKMLEALTGTTNADVAERQTPGT